MAPSLRRSAPACLIIVAVVCWGVAVALPFRVIGNTTFACPNVDETWALHLWIRFGFVAAGAISAQIGLVGLSDRLDIVPESKPLRIRWILSRVILPTLLVGGAIIVAILYRVDHLPAILQPQYACYEGP